MKKENSTEDILEKTIKERKKLPQEVKDVITKNIFLNTVMIIIMSLFVLLINTLLVKLNLQDFQNYLKVIQIIVCLISIGMFEYSYKKDSFKKSVYAIEFTGFSIAVLYAGYMYVLKTNVNFLINILILFIVYYFVKSIVVALCIRKKFLKENISDVKEIVKEEKKGYIDEDSKKTLKERKKAIQKKGSSKKK